MKSIDLPGFDAKFANDPDPWRTFSDRDEAHKRSAILNALGAEPVGRVLELAAGNGSNSVLLAKRALRLDATEGTPSGVALVKRAIGSNPRVRVQQLILPSRFPRARYDAIVIAEILYYLPTISMARVAGAVAATLRPGGALVLAHHCVDYPDFAQPAEGIHEQFLIDTKVKWHRRTQVRTGRWRVQSFIRR